MIEIKNVNFRYKGTDEGGLHDLSLTIHDGETMLLCGASGCGKTTVGRLINGLIPHYYKGELTGSVTVNGRDIAKITRKQIPRYRRNIGVVFQNFRLLPDRNVYENVAFAMRVVESPKREVKKKVPQMLSLVGLAHKYRSLPKQLSGGEQQRVAIARALVNEPKILLADEPTGNLDEQHAWEIMRLLEEINERGTTVVVVTHNMNFIKQMNKRVITIKKGVIVSDEQQEEATDAD